MSSCSCFPEQCDAAVTLAENMCVERVWRMSNAVCRGLTDTPARVMSHAVYRGLTDKPARGTSTLVHFACIRSVFDRFRLCSAPKQF